MTIKIGEKTYAVRRPRNDALDTALVEATGCNTAETARLLTGHPLAGHVARALLPMLAEGDRPAPHDLAVEIEAAGVLTVAAEVRAMLERGDAETPKTSKADGAAE